MAFSLHGKTALVTGSGRGIGREIARKLAQAGAAVLVNDLDCDALQQTVCDLRKAGHQVAHAIGDLTDPAFPKQLVQVALDTFGSIDIIVNNAGYSWDHVIQKTSDEQFQAMLEIHLVVPFRILRAASFYIRETAKKEIAAGRTVMRKVVNITSIAGTDGNPGQAGYSSGKAGVIGLTKTLAKEWGPYNVNVNAVGFGLIETRLVQPLRNFPDRTARARDPDRSATGHAGGGRAALSSGTVGHPRGSCRSGVVFLFSPVGLCHRRGSDLRRRVPFLTRPAGRGLPRGPFALRDLIRKLSSGSPPI